MIDILYYTDIDASKIKKQYNKTVAQLQNGNFIGADVKKMTNTGLYRAKLDDTNRLIFRFAKFGDKKYLLLLEIVMHHDYASSRFLQGAEVDETKLLPIAKPEQMPEEDCPALPFINPKSAYFHLLDKVISFDDDQDAIFHLPPPLIVIGSAGSGKTALTLEKIKMLRGSILYVTLSPFLVENSQQLYASNYYSNESHEVDFLSFKEFLETIRIPQGREISFRAFDGWFVRHRNTIKIRDSYKIYEEFRGVLVGMNTEQPFLSRQQYLSLGIRQSVFTPDERPQIYDLFEKYLRFLEENNYYDPSMIAIQWQPLSQPKYDFIIVDEVQDLTNAQLFILLKSLKKSGNFILCGDSNQIVHPNYFSWANVKSMFYSQDTLPNDVRILRANYRNSPQVTDVANRLLKIKNARFGSIDRESTYLVNPVSQKVGEVIFLPDNNQIKQELNRKTSRSAQYAIIVMNQEDKAEANKTFQSPLIFSVQEAKGLEYENIILVNFVSQYTREFTEISSGVSREELETSELRYARAKDKSDKSLDAYKFYINSFYVAMTRAVRNLYILENARKHPLLDLLGFGEQRQKFDMKESQSSIEEWQREARRLEQQGKLEQAERIHSNILKTQKTPWTPITMAELETLRKQALNPEFFNKKAKDRLFDFALIYNDNETIKKLSELKYRRADKPNEERNAIFRRGYAVYKADDTKKIVENIKKYGIDYRDEFNLTPLLAAIKSGAIKIAHFLIEQGANVNACDNFGANAFRIAFQNAIINQKFLEQQFSPLYSKLKHDHLKVKVEGHLVKIPSRSAEFFLFHLFAAAQPGIVFKKEEHQDQGLSMDDVMNATAPFPDLILPQYRKKRNYLNAILSKNEIERDDPYNKKLFLRLFRGIYVLNPDLEVLVDEDSWMNVYDIMLIPKMTRERNKEITARGQEKLNAKFREQHRKLMEKMLAQRRKEEEEWRKRWNW
jgi:hypothetical protein